MAIDTKLAFEIFRNETLRMRTRIIAIRSAVAVLGEAGTVPFHLPRVNWANRVLNEPEAEARKALIAMVATAVVLPAADDITDEQIENSLNSLINALAGAFNPVP